MTMQRIAADNVAYYERQLDRRMAALANTWGAPQIAVATALRDQTRRDLAYWRRYYAYFWGELPC